MITPSSQRIGIVICGAEKLAEPPFTPNDHLIVDELRLGGHQVSALVWGANTSHLSDRFDRIIVRSPWDYMDSDDQQRRGFLHWLQQLAAMGLVVENELPVPWGLHDMHGDVLQWCQDNLSSAFGNKYPDADAVDPLNDPTKQWKISQSDYHERKFWGEYTEAYEDLLSRCSTEEAPWFIIPSDHKWFRNLAIARIVVEYLEGLDLKFPAPTVDLKHIREEYHEAKKD